MLTVQEFELAGFCNLFLRNLICIPEFNPINISTYTKMTLDRALKSLHGLLLDEYAIDTSRIQYHSIILYVKLIPSFVSYSLKIQTDCFLITDSQQLFSYMFTHKGVLIPYFSNAVKEAKPPTRKIKVTA